MPFRRIPALHLPHALGVLAVPLVIPLRLKPPAAFFPQTDAPPQPPPPGRDTPACRKMRMSHGSAYSLGAARGGVASSSGTPLSAHDSARRGHRAAVAPVHGPFCRSASIHRATDALRSSTAWPTKAKETRKETSQICAPLKEIREENQPLEGYGAKYNREGNSPKKEGCAAGNQRAESDGAYKVAARAEVRKDAGNR